MIITTTPTLTTISVQNSNNINDPGNNALVQWYVKWKGRDDYLHIKTTAHAQQG